MLKIVQAEFIKSRHNKLFTICAAIAFAVPLLMAIKDIKISQNHGSFITFGDWTMMSQDVFLTVILTVLSGLIITFFCQKEYTERTIIGQLTCPVSRTEFLLGKLTIWSVWHMILTVLFLLATIIGAAMLYPGELSPGSVLQMGLSFIAHGIWIFLSLLPLLAVSVLQRSLFYPSLLLCLLFTFISTCSGQLPGLSAFILPWSAARLLSTMPLEGLYLIISVSSIIGCAVIGLALAFFWFRRQKI